jgi:hypothetical protein
MRLAIPAAILVIVLGVFVWPTVWNERSVTVGGRTVQIRSHRINGKIEALSPTGWRPMGVTSADINKSTNKPCSPEQLRDISPLFIDLVCVPPR